VILGGGVAGIAAALYLLDQGYPVTLIEARRFLGGRAFSFIDAETGLSVDNGQHVIVGCCSYFIDFLKRLDADGKWHLQPRLRLRVRDRQGKAGLLAASRLPAPFHLLPSFLAYPHLGAGDKIRALAALARARFTDRCQPYLERITFYQWLKQQRQSEQAIQNLWNLLVMPTLNDHVRDVSAAMGLMIVQEGMLEGCHNADVGYASDGLSVAVGEPARRHLLDRGTKLLLGSAVRRVCLESGRVKGVELASGVVVTGEVYVSALPGSALLAVLPRDVAEQPFFQGLKGLETSPIVNIHLWYDRPVMDGDFCALVDSPLQWVFNKGAILGKEETDQGQYICISISAAWEYIDQTREELAQQFIAEMAEAFPRARLARVKRSIVVKQRHATFRCQPGANELRPSSQTPIANLFLAGEWTNTGWPSTMESAVRSGYNAAQAITGNKTF
jgi:squalene-associated FAD-dependent desaturase